MIRSIGTSCGFVRLVQFLEIKLSQIPLEAEVRINFSNQDTVPFVDCSWQGKQTSEYVYQLIAEAIIHVIAADRKSPLAISILQDLVQILREQPTLDLEAFIRFRLRGVSQSWFDRDYFHAYNITQTKWLDRVDKDNVLN
jgi:hypothetical protein